MHPSHNSVPIRETCNILVHPCGSRVSTQNTKLVVSDTWPGRKGWWESQAMVPTSLKDTVLSQSQDCIPLVKWTGPSIKEKRCKKCAYVSNKGSFHQYGTLFTVLLYIVFRREGGVFKESSRKQDQHVTKYYTIALPLKLQLLQRLYLKLNRRRFFSQKQVCRKIQSGALFLKYEIAHASWLYG